MYVWEVCPKIRIKLFEVCSHGAMAIAIFLIATNGLNKKQCKCSYGKIATTILNSIQQINKSHLQTHHVNSPLYWIFFWCGLLFCSDNKKLRVTFFAGF